MFRQRSNMAEAFVQYAGGRNHLTKSFGKKTKRANSLETRNPSRGGIQSGRSVTPSAEDSDEKILNINWQKNDYEEFFKVCNTFEKTLEELDLNVNTHRIYEELNKIRSLIEKKILLFTMPKDDEKLFDSPVQSARDLSLSMQSLCSQKSYDLDMGSNSSFEKFMTAVNCPFCSEVQSDKKSFVKHLDESCSPHLNKKLTKEDHFPFAVFQILPNNTFKCNICYNAIQRNLRNFYVHMKGEIHSESYAKSARIKTYKNCLFCSCCKVLVYNNYTQISSHIHHEAHKTKCSNKKSSEYLLGRGIHCVFSESKKFKCLDCPSASAVCTTPRSVLDHFEKADHKKHKKKNVRYSPVFFCEVCSEEVHMYEVINHFTSSQHCDNEKKLKEGSLELCFCCDFLCESLIELSFHMESGCPGINKIRQQISDENEPEKKTGAEADVTKGPCIVVKNFTEIPELFKYFRKFGEIVKIESDNDQDVVIEFREKSTVDDILLLQEVITVGGTKLDITTNSRSGKSCEKVHKTESESENSENEVSDSSSKNEGDTDVDNAVMMIPDDDELDELFGRVSNHLISTAQKLNSIEEKKIQHDCVDTLKVEKCHLVGFSGSGLSFPSESIYIFCGIEGSVFIDAINPGFASLNDSDIFTVNLLKASYIRLCDSELWKNVECCTVQGPYSYVQCIHRETGRACTITFTRSVFVLTDMLRECIEKSKLVQPFCLIIRFWLSVHELKIQNFEFVLISLLVFFLIRENVVTLSVEKYQGYGVQSLLTKGETEALQPSSNNIKPTVNVKDLFQKFLCFVDTFDFDNCAINLPSPYPIPKSVFNQSKLHFLLGGKDPAWMKNCSMCILDPISCKNLAEDIEKKDKTEFLKIVGAAVRHYKIK